MAKKSAKALVEEAVASGLSATYEPKAPSIIKPLVTVAGQKHVLQEMFEQKDTELPIMTSIGLMRSSPNAKASWVSYVMKTQGAKVLSIEASEPDLKAITIEALKIELVQNFMNEDQSN